MSIPADGAAVPKESHTDGAPNKGPEEKLMDPDMRQHHPVCDVCDDYELKVAVKSCLTCNQNYCETHVRKHYTVPKLQAHTLTDVTEHVEEEMCPVHNRLLEMLCVTDGMLICIMCSVNEHQGHEKIIVDAKQVSIQTFNAEPIWYMFSTTLPPPGEIQFLLVIPESVCLKWGPPEGLKEPHRFRLICECEGEILHMMVIKKYSVKIDGLLPGKEYLFQVATEGEDYTLSRTVSACLYIAVPEPFDLKIIQSGPTSVTLSWTKAKGMEKVPQQFLIYYYSPGSEPCETITEDCYKTLSDLQPDTEYTVCVSTILNNGVHSEPARETINTAVPEPLDLKIIQSGPTSVTLSWTKAKGMEKVPQHFLIYYYSPGSEPCEAITEDCYKTLSDLQPDTQYTVCVSTILNNGVQSEPASETINTVCCLKELLSKTGLEDHYEEDSKLKLSTVLEIHADTTSDKSFMHSLPGAFLNNLMKVNVNARSERWGCDSDNSNAVNPLDLITAVFLCSDGLLQQQIALKMSMCQFAVPLLLPRCDTKQSTLMLWALRDIVKKFRSSSQANTKSFIEERIVASDIPMVSFVRLGESSLNKSQMLNKLLSNPQQYHDTFVHHDMDCGNVPRKISDGLVEISWYLPSGKSNMDKFTKPVALANLRGDIRSFETQFAFLCQTSAAIFVFSDDVEAYFKIMQNKTNKADFFLVINSQRASRTDNLLTELTTKFLINRRNMIIKKMENDAEFLKILQSSVSDILEKCTKKLTIENMADVACQNGILIDENCDCQHAKKMSDEITNSITDTVIFKKDQLPLQGEFWKEISQLEKERCRLKKAGNEDIEKYKSQLNKRHMELRKIQNEFPIKNAMTNFISGMSGSIAERSYFIKWMQIHLDNMSRQKLSALHEQYKNICQNAPEEKDKIADLDIQISDCSLGLEHFLRELGQLYESSFSFPNNTFRRQKIEDLPTLCAQIMLDGFPIELVDGDASNIPLKWISAVLTQVHHLVKSHSKVRVVTVIGIQGTGKSTLLNTMFGVQFAVSSGRCTRGAFMQLIKVNKELKEELKCDFIMVIDTEGLKSPELAKLDDSYEHDNELATLVIGLSDVTIVNISMENSTEMKDILQIVVHAFIRMKEVGKKPVCHFVHQNVSDMSAYDNNMRARKKLLEQLNEMTQAAARMENKEHFTKFTDVMEYDPDTSSSYIPGLWNGTPPMAPVNTGYSEEVYNFKKRLMQTLKECNGDNDLTHLLKWIESLWDSVKFEKFIFSFRNSLVADAFSRLCTEYNSWEWSFQKNIYSMMVCATNKISNFGLTDPDSKISIRTLLLDLEKEVFHHISLGETEIQKKIIDYFKKQDGHVSLVEKYKGDFVASAKTLRRETENKVKDSLHGAVEIKEGMAMLEKIKSSHAHTVKNKILALLQSCRQKKSDLSEQDLEDEFESMWNKTFLEIQFSDLPRRNVAQDAFLVLSRHLLTRGGFVNSMLVENSLRNCGEKDFVVKAEGQAEGEAKDVAKQQDQRFYSKELQDICKTVITNCQNLITQRVESNTDYYDTYIKELLEIIDEILLHHKNVHEECEVSLKLHICGIAAREFQKMHDHFNKVNDPRNCLEQSKKKYLTDFIDLFHERDQCRKKAKDFTTQCLHNAVKEYVTKMIGPDVVDEVKTGEGSEDYSTRTSFQFSVLKQLLTDGEYEKYREYIKNYEQFVKNWLFDHIVKQMSKESSLEKLEKKHLKNIVKLITDAIVKVKTTTSNDNDIKLFVQNICSFLGDKLVIQKDALDSIMTLNCSRNTDQFADNLIEFVGEMEVTLNVKYNNGKDIEDRLRSLPFKPQENIFSSVFGCGEVCPFCKAPCEAGGKQHSKHFTSIHRPQGIHGWKTTDKKMLVSDICSSDVISENKFNISQVGAHNHPYKDYQTYFPDWIITGDPSIQATDYWKYVMATFNDRIAEDNNALPADIPEDWREIKCDDAMLSLKTIFNIK